MKQTLILLCFTISALSIAPQVDAKPQLNFQNQFSSFSGNTQTQSVPRPVVPLSHPLPPSNSITRSGKNTGSGSYNQGSTFVSSTNRVNSYTPTSPPRVNSYTPTRVNSYTPNRVDSYAPSSSSSASSSYRPSSSQVSSVNTRTNEITNLRSVFEDNADGSYNYAFENSDGTKTEQRGYLKNAGTENEIFVQEGSYQYYGPDGVVYTVTYISDENGYQPSGVHLPSLPNPVPVRSNVPSSSSSSSYSRPSNSNTFNNRNNQYNRS